MFEIFSNGILVVKMIKNFQQAVENNSILILYMEVVALTIGQTFGTILLATFLASVVDLCVSNLSPRSALEMSSKQMQTECSQITSEA